MIAFVKNYENIPEDVNKYLSDLELLFRKNKDHFKRKMFLRAIISYKDFPFLSEEANDSLFFKTKMHHYLWWDPIRGNMRYGASKRGDHPIMYANERSFKESPVGEADCSVYNCSNKIPRGLAQEFSYAILVWLQEKIKSRNKDKINDR